MPAKSITKTSNGLVRTAYEPMMLSTMIAGHNNCGGISIKFTHNLIPKAPIMEEDDERDKDCDKRAIYQIRAAGKELWTGL